MRNIAFDRYLLKGRIPSFSLLVHRVYRGKRWYKGGGDNGSNPVGPGPVYFSDHVEDGECSCTINKDYTIVEMIGSGNFANVYKAKNNMNYRTVAIKCVRLNGMNIKDKRNLEREIKIMQSLYHPNLLRIQNHYFDKKRHYIVMDYISGGDLLDHILNYGKYSEIECQKLTKVLLEAVSFLHSKKIVHRDLKPENILVNQTDRCSIQIADFGLSTRLNKGEFLKTICGTLEYSAPEVLKGQPYDEKIDVWSIGVIIYVSLSATSPFVARDNDGLLVSQIMSGSFHFPEKKGWGYISNSAILFIKSLLQVTPSLRLTTVDAQQHVWLDSLKTKQYTPRFIRQRGNFLVGNYKSLSP